MGAGRSKLFRGTKGAKQSNERNIDTNVSAMRRYYPITNGYFGEKSKNCRIIKSDNQYQTASDFYHRIAKGGAVVKELPHSRGEITKLTDGTLIVYRVLTKTHNSPAVEIKIIDSSCIKNQKIHFVKG